MRLEDLLAASDDRLSHGLREEALEARQTLELRNLVADTLGELFVHVLELVLQRLDPQKRAHASEELLPIDRLGEEVVGADLEPLDALALRIERSDQDDGQERGFRRRTQPPAEIVAVDLGHQD